jgi:hypothetical protein
MRREVRPGELPSKNDPQRTPLEWLEIVLLAAALAVLTGLFVVGLFAAAKGDVAQCAKQVPSSSSTGAMLAIVAVVGFAAGRAVAGARKWIHQAPAVTASKIVRTDALLQGLLFLFLLLVALLLGYETYAVAHFTQAPPITEYVRCTAGTHPWLAGIGTAAITVLLGNWIWYPTE